MQRNLVCLETLTLTGESLPPVSPVSGMLFQVYNPTNAKNSVSQEISTLICGYLPGITLLTQKSYVFYETSTVTSCFSYWKPLEAHGLHRAPVERALQTFQSPLAGAKFELQVKPFGHVNDHFGSLSELDDHLAISRYLR